MTGFRLAAGGAAEVYGVAPDMVCFGKVIGGGLLWGRSRPPEIMAHLAPEGPVYQAGTLSGNPLAMSAGLTLLAELHANRKSMRTSPNGARPSPKAFAR